MFIRRMVPALFFLILLMPSSGDAETAWQMQNSGISDLDIRSLAIFPKDSHFICAAGLRHVYFSSDSGNLWQEIFSFGAEDNEVNFVAFSTTCPEMIFLATTKGLLTTQDQGKNWQQTFRKIGEEEKNVRWIVQDTLEPQKIYLGAGDSGYFSGDLGKTWQRLNGGLPQSEVKAIVLHPTNPSVIYLANTWGLFKSIDRGQSWKRIYLTSFKVNEEDAEENEEEGESANTEENENLINCIALNQHNPTRIFLATGCGVFASSDAGETWDKLSSQGLSNDKVDFLLLPADKDNLLYAATRNGVFVFAPSLNSWNKIYRGMTFSDVRSLAWDADEQQLYAGTKEGVFRTGQVEVEKKDSGQLLKEISLNEPTINQVQEAALKYAEVIHPKNIQTLRRTARLKALLPDVSLDYDKTVSVSTNPSYKESVVGPRAWGLTLSWDVGDLVFNEQLRLIDSNTRLMVQLRDDILNEVTRLYYERRKLETELMLAQPKMQEESLAKSLRLEELTANLDGLTGGYFSRQLQR